MNHLSILLFSLLTITLSAEKNRLLILADMGNEPDEMQQMIHMMTCANEFDLEGLIAVTGKYLRPESHKEYRRVTHPELFHQIIDAYEKDLPNLEKHAQGWPEPASLRLLVKAGQPGYGIADVGENQSSPGSDLILKALKKDDPRPLWLVVNAGSNTLAQALFEARKTHSPADLDRLLSKLRVFENGAQDNAGSWICQQFPNIHWIRSNYQTYAYGGPGGTDGDTTVNLGPNFWGDYPYSTQGQLDWQKEHIMNGHGALGDLYPERRFRKDGPPAFIEGGGTIPWMGLVNKGLFDINQPSWGGWGGRFSREKVANFWSRHLDIQKDEREHTPFHTYREVSDYWTDPRDQKIYPDNYSPVWRWREAMFNNQICRMDWCTKSFQDANHHPIAAVNGDTQNTIIRLSANAGQTLSFDASASTDPDNDLLTFKWWIYQEAGTYPGNIHLTSPGQAKTEIQIPTGGAKKQIHLILTLKDQNPIAPLFDYRRIVIDISDKAPYHTPKQKH